MAVRIFGGGNRSTRRKPPTCRKSKLYHTMLYRVCLAKKVIPILQCVILWVYLIYFFIVVVSDVKQFFT